MMARMTEKHPVSKMNLVTSLTLIALLLMAVPAWAKSKTEEQKEVKKAADEILAELYKLQPSAKKVIKDAAGYAAFNNFGMKIFVAGGGSGSGLAYNNKTKKTTYMKMVEVQAGLGIGIKKFKLVWVFDTQQLLDQFVNSGWELGAQTTASAKMGNKGAGMAGAVAVSPGVWLFQITSDGLALELTAKGTKYYKDDDLN
jgi:lipid-binding SYLF domain-containing protein